ncbi:zf-TFIIB domain-containing protein [Roseateles sp.]|uniref:TFIIB-type zinc ribbon-containing protein n=1 Tax=Roseateles sp. TaxID=1971397 RepID=UPI003BA4524C
MKCPRCPSSSLVLSERQGVEIDYCPDCRGIWLDRGELDKLLEFAADNASHSARRSVGHEDFEDSDYPSSSSGRHGNQGHRGHEVRSGPSHRRKKSWLNDFFD